MFFEAKPANQYEKETKAYLKALKTVTEQNLAPAISSYCLKRFHGETPFVGEHNDPYLGRLMIALLQSIVENKMLAPPFTSHPSLVIEIMEVMCCNVNAKPKDFRRLIEGKWVPSYVVRNTERVFRQFRGELYGSVEPTNQESAGRVDGEALCFS